MFYWCDPSKAIGCKKTACFIYGGMCALTTYRAYGIRPAERDECSSSLLTKQYREKYRKLVEEQKTKQV